MSEVNLNFAYEINRLKTFEYAGEFAVPKWLLATLGFYYTGYGDKVICHFCKVELAMWERNDDVAREHIRWSVKCPLMHGEQTDNIPISVSTLNRYLPMRKNTSVPQTTQTCLTNEKIFTTKPNAYNIYGWTDDMCLCGLARLFSSNSIKGDAVVPKTNDTNNSNNNNNNHSNDNEINSSIDDHLVKFRKDVICKVCFETEYNTILFPCMHVVTCEKCSDKINKCPYCNRPIVLYKKIYLS